MGTNATGARRRTAPSPWSAWKESARASATTSCSTGSTSSVAAGEVLVVIGASGSGKSTLLRCVNLLEPLDSGRIFFEGEEITGKGIDVSAVRQRIGMVFQQFNLFPHLTVLDNVTLAARRIRKMRRDGRRGTRAASCSRRSGWRRRPSSIRTSSRAASSSASRSRGR